MKPSPPLRTARPVVAAALLLVAVAAPLTLGQAFPREERARLTLVADRTAYPAGSEAKLAALMEIDPGFHTNSHHPTYDYLIPTDLTLAPPAGWEAAEVVYPPGVTRTFAFADEPLSVYEGKVHLPVGVAIPAGVSGDFPIQASLSYQACDDHSCLPPVTTEASLTLTVGPGGKPAHPEVFATAGTPPPGTARGTGSSAPALGLVLLLGVVGGVILNVMPCVLPVLSLKLFGLVKSAGQGRSHVVVSSLATSAGILVSFWVLAGAAIAARAAGAAVGWGTQFQHPAFVTFLAVVVILFCLNLWGLFEIPLPQSLGRIAGSGSRQGIPGHFVSGLFATLMATPCSAPFLGTAVGFALAQPAGTIVAVFTAVGVGMALPYLALAAAPGAARFLPRPGAWMDHVRKLMGFLLAAAAVWLFYVLANQVSSESLAAIELGLLALALFVWLRYRALQGPSLRRLAALGMVAIAVGTVAFAARTDGRTTTRATSGSEGERLIAWQDFDRDRATALAGEGRVVFVDVTADWCFTCKVNENLVLETPEVAAAFARFGVVPMRADWTNRDDRISSFMAQYGRSSIPFYLIFRPGDEPYVFSELLTKDHLLTALEEIGGAPPANAGLGG